MGQRLGSGDALGAKQVVTSLLYSGPLVFVPVLIVAYSVKSELLQLMTDHKATLMEALPALPFYFASMLPDQMKSAVRGLMRGMGK